MKRKFRFLVILSPLVVLLFSNYVIKNNAADKTYSESSKIFKNKVGLVLGTAKYLQDGRVNLYYQYRINAAVKLYKSKKIEFLLVSGDNGNVNYDEPTTFKNDLIANGIPANKIFLDYAGFRTLDSVIRAKKVFEQSELTIISQKFHNERAIYIAESIGISAIGFNAKDISGRYSLKTRVREYFARVKVFTDILFRVKPRFLGPTIQIK